MCTETLAFGLNDTLRIGIEWWQYLQKVFYVLCIDVLFAVSSNRQTEMLKIALLFFVFFFFSAAKSPRYIHTCIVYMQRVTCT